MTHTLVMYGVADSIKEQSALIMVTSFPFVISTRDRGDSRNVLLEIASHRPTRNTHPAQEKDQ